MLMRKRLVKRISLSFGSFLSLCLTLQADAVQSRWREIFLFLLLFFFLLRMRSYPPLPSVGEKNFCKDCQAFPKVLYRRYTVFYPHNSSSPEIWTLPFLPTLCSVADMLFTRSCTSLSVSKLSGLYHKGSLYDSPCKALNALFNKGQAITPVLFVLVKQLFNCCTITVGANTRHCTILFMVKGSNVHLLGHVLNSSTNGKLLSCIFT